MTTIQQPEMPSTPGGDSGNARRPPRPLPLKTPRDCARALAKIINETRRGDLETRRASVAVYGINTLLGAIAAADTDQRLSALEARLGL